MSTSRGSSVRVGQSGVTRSGLKFKSPERKNHENKSPTGESQSARRSGIKDVTGSDDPAEVSFA